MNQENKTNSLRIEAAPKDFVAINKMNLFPISPKQKALTPFERN